MTMWINYADQANTFEPWAQTSTHKRWLSGRFNPVNLSALKGAMISATSSVGEFTADSMIDAHSDFEWHSADNSDQVVTAVFDRARALDTILLAAHNLSIEATVKAQLFLEGALVAEVEQAIHRPLFGAFTHPGAFLMGAFGYPAADDELEPLWPYTDILFHKPIVADTIKLSLVDVNNAAGYMSINYLSIGHSFAPELNFEFGYRAGFIPQLNKQRTTSGALKIDYGAPLRAITAQYRGLNHGEITRLNQLMLQVQTHGHPVAWCGFPARGGAAEQQHVVLAYITDWTAPNETNASNGQFDIQLEEVTWHA